MVVITEFLSKFWAVNLCCGLVHGHKLHCCHVQWPESISADLVWPPFPTLTSIGIAARSSKNSTLFLLDVLSGSNSRKGLGTDKGRSYFERDPWANCLKPRPDNVHFLFYMLFEIIRWQKEERERASCKIIFDFMPIFFDIYLQTDRFIQKQPLTLVVLFCSWRHHIGSLWCF